MSQKNILWIIFFVISETCFAAKPSSLVSITTWPSLITSRPKCPSVPSWEDLKPALQDLTSRPRTIPYFQLLEIVKNGNKTKCEDNVVELHAEELETNETESSVTNPVENIDKSDQYEQIHNIEHENTIPNSKSTTVDPVDPFESLPKYIPIFRPIISDPAKQHEVLDKNSATPCCNTNNFNTIVENPKANVVGNLNTIFDDRTGNRDIVVHFITNGKTNPILKVESLKENYDHALRNFNTALDGRKGNKDIVVQFVDNGNTKPILKVDRISCDKCPIDAPLNALTINVSPNALPLNSIPSQVTHLNNVNHLPNQNIKCIEPVKKCTEVNDANLVFFKPETISLMNVDGDLLKKVTMTVLVPTHASKLNI